MADNVLVHLKPKSSNGSTVKRRALEPKQMAKLLRKTATSKEKFGMNGRERALLYRLAVESGLRVSELGVLTTGSFDLKGNAVKIEAGYTKNRDEAVLPLRKKTVELLKEYLKNKTPNAPAFNLPHKSNFANMLRSDLLAAGINPADNGNGKIDFHSLRHTTGTFLAASGVHPKVAQSIMRHSDINLTMLRYTHTLRGQESRAIEGLPDLRPPSEGEQKLMGTDNTPAGAYKPAYKRTYKKGFLWRSWLFINWQCRSTKHAFLKYF